MKKAKIQREIFVTEVTSNSASGYLKIQSTEDLTIDNINGLVYFEVRGRMSTSQDVILKFNIETGTLINKDKVHKIPFNFNTNACTADTYTGKNVSFLYKLEIKINVNKGDIEKLERTIFSKIKSAVTSDYSLKIEKRFKVQDLKSKYRIEEAKTTFNLQPNTILLILVSIIFGAISLNLIPEFSVIYLIIAIGTIYILKYLITSFISKSLGIITMETKENNDTFQCKLSKPRNFILKNQNLYYQITEQVIDNRGTSSSTYRETILTSERKNISNNKVQTIKFNYPTKQGLQTYQYKDASILWEMNFEGHYLGITLNYKCTFQVNRIKD